LDRQDLEDLLEWEILLDGRQEIDRIFDRRDEIVTLGRVSRRMPGTEALASWKICDGKVTRREILGFGATEVHEALKVAALERRAVAEGAMETA
jgi:hypothetical protein